MPKGSLVMVGVGIKIVGHVTLETQAFIEQAEKVLYMVANDPMVDWIRTLNLQQKRLTTTMPMTSCACKHIMRWLSGF